jgi:hypothetical protein
VIRYAPWLAIAWATISPSNGSIVQVIPTASCAVLLLDNGKIAEAAIE